MISICGIIIIWNYLIRWTTMIPMTLITLIRIFKIYVESPNSLPCTLEDRMVDTEVLSITPPLIKTLIPCLGNRILTNFSTSEMYWLKYKGNFSFQSWRRRCHVLLHPWSWPFRFILCNFGKIDQTIWNLIRLRFERTRFQQEIAWWLWLLDWNIKLISDRSA